MPASWTQILVNESPMEAYIAKPATGGPYHPVIVVQEIWGVNAYIQSIANKLASAGFYAIAPSLFHREGLGTIGVFEETDLALERLGRLDYENILNDLRHTENFIANQDDVISDKVGIIGFCVGGRIAYLAAANLDSVAAAVDFYGGRCFVPFGDGVSPFDQTAYINAPLLGLFGEDDQNPTTEEVDKMAMELTKHQKKFEFHVYPGASHGFNCEERPAYRRDAALHAWGKAIEWFNSFLVNKNA